MPTPRGCGDRRKSGGSLHQASGDPPPRLVGVTSGLVRSRREESRRQRACGRGHLSRCPSCVWMGTGDARIDLAEEREGVREHP